MKLRVLLASSIFPAIVLACSGATETELYAPFQGMDGTEPGDGDDATPDDDTSSSSSSGGSSSSSGKPGTSTSSSSSGGTTKKDSGVDTGPQPPQPPKHPIPCGEGAPCEAGSQVCCASVKDTGSTYQCKPAAPGACPGALRIACDDRTDCPADQICCGMLVTGVGYSAIECKSSCNSVPGVRAVHFCDPEAPFDECIDYGGVCIPSQSVPGYFVCGQ
jgi:hypothetical protein